MCAFLPLKAPAIKDLENFCFTRGGGGGEGDELVNRSYRDRAADDLGHRDVTRNLSREL